MLNEGAVQRLVAGYSHMLLITTSGENWQVLQPQLFGRGSALGRSGRLATARCMLAFGQPNARLSVHSWRNAAVFSVSDRH